MNIYWPELLPVKGQKQIVKPQYPPPHLESTIVYEQKCTYTEFRYAATNCGEQTVALY